jgi:hypothetical protein
MLRLDQPLVAEIFEVIFERAGFAVIERLAEVRRADDAESSRFAQELLFLRAQLKSDDVADSPRRPARVCRGNRAAAFTRHVLSGFTVLALYELGATANVGTLLVSRVQVMMDGIFGYAASRRTDIVSTRSRSVSLAATWLFLGNL